SEPLAGNLISIASKISHYYSHPSPLSSTSRKKARTDHWHSSMDHRTPHLVYISLPSQHLALHSTMPAHPPAVVASAHLASTISLEPGSNPPSDPLSVSFRMPCLSAYPGAHSPPSGDLSATVSAGLPF